MKQLTKVVIVTSLLLAGTGVAFADSVIIFIAESTNETIAALAVGVLDADGNVVGEPVEVKPDAQHRYQVAKDCHICPDASSYTTDDSGDSFTLTVTPGAKGDDVFLGDFVSEGGDTSPLETGESMKIPTFGFGRLRGPDWVVVISSPCEGGTEPEASFRAQPTALATCPTPEPGTIALLTIGCAGLFVASRWRRCNT